mgnify:FL=1|jgi:hypothetical protein
MCVFNQSAEVYHEVGSNPPDARFFELQTINSSAVRVHSLNGSFPDAIASLVNKDGKIAWRAKLFKGKEYRGILRSNGKGTLGCCHGNSPESLKECPVVSWWSDDGDRSCWQATQHPSEPEGACSE